MKRICPAALAASIYVSAFSGCQHIPPSPLDLIDVERRLSVRELDIEPVRAYAARLAEASSSEPAPFDVSDGLTLREAEAVALWYNAGVRIARLEAERASSLADTAGRWSDPEIGGGIGRKRVESEPTDAFLEDAADAVDRTWVQLASLSITIPTSGRLGAERSARRAERDAAWLAASEVEWRMLSDLRAAWIHWSRAVDRLDIVNEHIRTLEGFTQTARALAEAGELDSGSARLFSIELGRAQALHEEWSHRTDAMRMDILGRLGLVSDAPVTLMPLQEVPTPPMVIDASLWIEHHPTLARLGADYDAAEARLRFELRKQYPDITVSPAWTDEENETSLVFGFGLPLPVWNANRAGIANAAAEREIARARAEGTLQTVANSLARDAVEYRGARARREHLQGGPATEVDLQLEEARRLLALGEIDVAFLFQTLTQVFEIKQELLNALADEQLLAAQLNASISPMHSISIPDPENTP